MLLVDVGVRVALRLEDTVRIQRPCSHSRLFNHPLLGVLGRRRSFVCSLVVTQVHRKLSRKHGEARRLLE